MEKRRKPSSASTSHPAAALARESGGEEEGLAGAGGTSPAEFGIPYSAPPGEVPDLGVPPGKPSDKPTGVSSC